MPTPTESADLILKLFDLRREPVLREARAWFTGEFNPTTYEEFTQALMGEKSAWFRMVTGYWDMAASLVAFEGCGGTFMRQTRAIRLMSAGSSSCGGGLGSVGRSGWACRALSLPQQRVRLKLTPRKPERFMRRTLRAVDEGA